MGPERWRVGKGEAEPGGTLRANVRLPAGYTGVRWNRCRRSPCGAAGYRRRQTAVRSGLNTTRTCNDWLKRAYLGIA